jgi:hypothetical protein
LSGVDHVVGLRDVPERHEVNQECPPLRIAQGRRKVGGIEGLVVEKG